MGYRVRAEWNDASRSYGVHLNPRLASPVTLDATDKVIVLAAG